MSNRSTSKLEVPEAPRSVETLALWGGIECTVNRVGDVYQDQVVRSGHHEREEDLAQIAALGIRTLRYPVLWERTAPSHPDELDWRWPDKRLARLRQLGINPIVGLVHHGCGPRYATFERSAFERELPRYARRVAERYPWVKQYTPINEPLTTARFSGLYGHWYPHGQSDRLFVDLLLRECRATVRAMRAIRTVRPDAQLVQTEDLGYTHSTPALAGQAEWENQRRWLTWDLLCGRVTPDHYMWEYLRRSGATEQALWELADNPCPPAVIGVNHYVTSERYLHRQPGPRPSKQSSLTAKPTYIDTEVVRAAPHKRIGIGGLLCQAWERYTIPLAVTEAHLGCTVDEQMRWLGEVWQQAQQAKNEGVDVRAVTAWALFGLYDWHCLLTRREDIHEPGIFSLASGQPEPTELTKLVTQITSGQPIDAILPKGPGWWQHAG